MSEALKTLQDEIIEEQGEYDSLKKNLENAAAILEEKKRRLIFAMNEAGLTSFKTAKGSIVLNRRFAVTTPKGDDLATFIDGLDEGTRRALLSVNYQVLNGWYKEEFEKAKERGDFDWCPVGLKPPSVSEYLSVKR